MDGSYNDFRGGFASVYDLKRERQIVMKIPNCQGSLMAERMAVLRAVLHIKQMSNIFPEKAHILSDAKHVIEDEDTQSFIRQNHIGGGSWIPRECNKLADGLFTVHNMNQANHRCNKGLDVNLYTYMIKAYNSIFSL